MLYFNKNFPIMPQFKMYNILMVLSQCVILSLSFSVSERKTPRCSEVFNLTTGAIYYKPFEQVIDNERCAWTIATPGATKYTVSIQYLGSPTNEPASGQELVFTGVKYNAALEPIMSTYLPTGTGVFEVEDANILVVVFHSSMLNGQESTGFALQYEAEGNTVLPSTHYVLESPTFEFKYPPQGNYGNRELASFLFPPSNNIYDGKTKTIWYKTSSLYSCNDALYWYTFNITTPDNGKWQLTRKICSATQHDDSTDLVLVIFQSDTRDVASGFWFWFNSC